MKGLLALIAATTARLYTPRLFPPRPEPPLPPLTQEACDRQARDERRARRDANATCAPLVDGGCATSCCRTGAEEDTARARRWAAARSYILASLATSDPACAARATVENLLAHTTDVLVVVHRGCRVGTSGIDRGARRVKPGLRPHATGLRVAAARPPAERAVRENNVATAADARPPDGGEFVLDRPRCRVLYPRCRFVRI